jgi:hypothetical protein
MSEQSLKPGWKMVKFGEVVKNANLVERDPGANDIERIVGLEHIDPENLHIRRWNSVADGTSFTRKFVPGQTLFGKRRAYQRKVAYAEFEGICSGDILTFEPKNRKVLLPELLPFICQSNAFFDHALDTSAGSLSPRTSWTALKDFEFPLPPIDEQKRIAEILWAADEAVECWLTTVNNLNFLDALLSSALLETNNNSSKKLGDYIQLISGQHITAKDYTTEPPGVPYITGPADFPEGQIIVSKFTLKPKVQCQTGDILVTCKGSGTGKSIQADQEYCISRQLMAVRPTRMSPMLLKKILSAFGEQLNKEAKGLIPGISRTDILDKPVNIPSGQSLSLIEEKFIGLENALDDASKHYNRLKQLRDALLNQGAAVGGQAHV